MGVIVDSIDGSRLCMAPDLPPGGFSHPGDVLDDDVLCAILFLGFGGRVAGARDLGLGCGLSTGNAQYNLADAGVWEVGDFCCSIGENAHAGEEGGWCAEVFGE